MPQHQAASGQFDRNANPADGVGSLTNGPRTHPAHAEGAWCIRVSIRDGQNGNPGLGGRGMALLAACRHALRTIGRSPAFAIAFTLMLAVGVGSTAAVFSIVAGVMLKSYPYPDSQRLVRLEEHYEGVKTREFYLSNVAYYALRNPPSSTLAAIAAYRVGDYTVTFDRVPARVRGVQASAQIFDVLRMRPALGRAFTAGETAGLSVPEVVLSSAFWRTRFNADPSVLGHVLLVDGVAHEIVGIAPPGFYFPEPATRFWTRWTVEPPVGPNPTVTLVLSIARLREGTTNAQAAAESTARVLEAGRKTLGQRVAFGGESAPQVRTLALREAETAQLKPAMAFLRFFTDLSTRPGV
jgi:MacB-like periplasmic core domain